MMPRNTSKNVKLLFLIHVSAHKRVSLSGEAFPIGGDFIVLNFIGE